MLAWRIAQFPLILAIIYLISFFFVWVAPGSPFGQSERKLNEVTERALKQKFHAESWQQFLGYYPYNIVRSGDFGPRTKAVYDAKLGGLATVIGAIAPDVLAVEEVGDPDALSELVDV